MKTIFKYPYSDVLMLPDRACVLSAQMQDGGLWLWCLVNTEYPVVERQFRMWGTGWDLTDECKDYKLVSHISTVQDGEYVWHIFEVIP